MGPLDSHGNGFRNVAQNNGNETEKGINVMALAP